jgi:alanyl-tRNA synthetase
VDIRKCADGILNVISGVCVMLSGDDEQGYRYAAGIRQGDIRALVKEMNQQLNGRGGGKPFFAQGTLKAALSDAESFFAGKGFTFIV